MRIALYFSPAMRVVTLLGCLSGLPLALTSSTLLIWLAEEGLSKTTIGTFAAVATPYAIKFLWSPLIDHLALPVLWRLGRRKSWMIFAQTLVAFMIALMAVQNPREAPQLLALCAFLLASASATVDMVIDAYRVERLMPEEQAAGSAAIVFGYRIGMLISGAGALFLAELLGWSEAYLLLAGIAGLGVLFMAGIEEPEAATSRHNRRSIREWLNQAVITPFVVLMQQAAWPYILAFVVAFKLGDAFAGVMTGPFLIDLAFSKSEIAGIVKTYGLVATLLGAFWGGMLAHRLSMGKSLWVAAILQMVSNLVFCLQSLLGHDVAMLVVTITIENVTGGLGTAIFVAYLSRLCHREYTATHYALLSSLASFGRSTLSASAGAVAESLGWTLFFAATALIALPGLILLFVMQRKQLL